jgi:hypothetical protein
LREQQIGEVNLPDLLENFTAFQFIPATKTHRSRLSGAYRCPCGPGDQIVVMRRGGYNVRLRNYAHVQL